MNTLLKKAIAECIGTFVLVFVACGVAGWTGGEPVSTSLAFGLTIVAMAYSIGRISGCHVNPAVSLGCLLTKRMTVQEFLYYVVAQFIGALLGAVLVFGFFQMSGVPTGDACNNIVGAGVGNPYDNYNAGWVIGGILAAIGTEVILTCIFVYVILNVTDEKATEGDEYKRGTSQIAGILIGLTLTLVHLVGIGLTGTSVNPARSFATAVSQAIYFESGWALSTVWIFLAAPMLGAVLAALLYNFLHNDNDAPATTEVKTAPVAVEAASPAATEVKTAPVAEETSSVDSSVMAD